MSAGTRIFNFGERVGLLLITEAACFSAIAVTGLLLYIAFSSVAVRRRAHRLWKIDSALHVYLLNLLLWDLVQALGGLMNIRWVIRASVTDGAYCTAQGAVKQLGDVGSSTASLIIAVHTFATLVFRRNGMSSITHGILTLVICWAFLVIIFIVDIAVNGAPKFYGNTGYWCWISSEFPVQRMVLDYVWMFIAALFNIVAYVPLYLVFKGVLAFDGWKVYRPELSDKTTFKHPNSLAIKMLIYPATFTFTVLPIAIVRWTAFSHDHIPFGVTVFADVIFVSSGLFNVVLYSLTRPFLLPQRGARGRMIENTFSLDFNTQNRSGRRGSFEMRSPGSVTPFSQDDILGHSRPPPVRIVVSRQPYKPTSPSPPSTDNNDKCDDALIRDWQGSDAESPRDGESKSLSWGGDASPSGQAV